eukprot:3102379-Rhodomonas_salina.3
MARRSDGSHFSVNARPFQSCGAQSSQSSLLAPISRTLATLRSSALGHAEQRPGRAVVGLELQAVDQTRLRLGPLCLHPARPAEVAPETDPPL